MNSNTLLLRQIHPSFLQGGRASSQAFNPTPKDEKKLSAYDGDMIEPLESYNHYTTTLNMSSAGILGVTVEECEVLFLQPKSDPEPFPEHVLIDFSDHGTSARKKKAKKLKYKAEQRGWLLKNDS